ncbi:MAG: SufD family Fe-S cluster assembly protein, partial [Alistipes sp.]|nr:SufD family Fe-S cluster assembly protein [Alistipes sp.]
MMAGGDFFSDETRFAPVAGCELHLKSGEGDDRPLLVRNPQRLTVTVAAGRAARIVLLHEENRAAEVEMRLAEGAAAEVVQLFLAEGASSMTLDQAAGSDFRLTSCLLAGASARYRFDLNGAQAANRTDALFLAAGRERCTIDLRTNHAVPDCASRSLVKGAASGTARGEFRGLVYVARDAQRTDARQQSRNLL